MCPRALSVLLCTHNDMCACTCTVIYATQCDVQYFWEIEVILILSLNFKMWWRSLQFIPFHCVCTGSAICFRSLRQNIKEMYVFAKAALWRFNSQVPVWDFRNKPSFVQTDNMLCWSTGIYLIIMHAVVRGNTPSVLCGWLPNVLGVRRGTGRVTYHRWNVV